jgi:Spy/CpxP family protein refolding chaperone
MKRKTMKISKWIKILLIASLAFNLAFVTSTIAKKFFQDHENSQNNSIQSPEFILQKNQKQGVRSIMNHFRIRLVKIKHDILEKRMEIIEELSDPECDFARLKTKTNELNTFENQMNNLFVDTLIRINNLLNPRQRLSLLLKLSQNWFFIHEHESIPNHHHDFRGWRKK